MATFNIGDVVQLKSGGPLMTVVHVSDSAVWTDCMYFDVHDHLHKVTVKTESLMLGDKE